MQDICPGCGQLLVDDPNMGDVVTLDSRTVSGDWHELCADAAKDGSL